MKTVKQLINDIGSRYKAARILNRKETQLKRWQDCGAKIDADGQVWIKSGKTLDVSSIDFELII